MSLVKWVLVIELAVLPLPIVIRTIQWLLDDEEGRKTWG